MEKARLKLETVDRLWQDRINKTTRNEIRRALENPNLTIHWAKDKQEAIKAIFYPLYLRAMKRFGTPPHSLGYFLKMSDKIELISANFNEKPIASILGWQEDKNMVIGYSPSDPAYWQIKANNLLYFEFIKAAVKQGYEYVDFGPVRYEGQLQYKKKWGCDIYEGNEKRINPDLWFYKILRFFWKTFVPLKLTPYLGKLFRE